MRVRGRGGALHGISGLLAGVVASALVVAAGPQPAAEPDAADPGALRGRGGSHRPAPAMWPRTGRMLAAHAVSTGAGEPTLPAPTAQQIRRLGLGSVKVGCLVRDALQDGRCVMSAAWRGWPNGS